MPTIKKVLRHTLRILRNPAQRKHLARWWISLRPNYLLDERKPWLTFDAIDFLSSLDLNHGQVFEYGSGGSTLFCLDKGAGLTSIEHDEGWHRILCTRYINREQGIDYRLVEPEYSNEFVAEPADPHNYGSAVTGLEHYSFQRYCSQIDEFPDASFDLVLVDGRARPSCIQHSVKKVRVGGHLLLDNTEREYYLRSTLHMLHDYGRTVFHGVVPGLCHYQETTVFSKFR